MALSEFNQIHCRHRSVANGGDEEGAKAQRLKDKLDFKTSFDSSEERVLDAQLLEMKAQVRGKDGRGGARNESGHNSLGLRLELFIA